MTEEPITAEQWNFLMGHNQLWTSYECQSDGSVSCIGHIVSYGGDGKVLSESHDAISTYLPSDVKIIDGFNGFGSPPPKTSMFSRIFGKRK